MHRIDQKIPCVLIITGPTASGKTALSEFIVQKNPGEIINADVGQFYVPLSIGTAKPDLSAISYTAHGFDLINEPCDLSVVAYRALVVNLVNQVAKHNKLPVLVGGSLFYIKSLFFPPHEQAELGYTEQFISPVVDGQSLWQQLYAIDPVRAQELHPNDEYRIKRALAIWQKTGIKPSLYKPIFQPPFRAMIVFVNPDRSILNEKIKKRVHIMMQQGWVEETEKLVGTEWESFLQKKGLIGYPELIDWIKRGKMINEFDQVITTIQNQTTDYAKRQVTFWKSFSRQLESCASGVCDFYTISDVSEQEACTLSSKFIKFCS